MQKEALRLRLTRAVSLANKINTVLTKIATAAELCSFRNIRRDNIDFEAPHIRIVCIFWDVALN